jgi:hypothetical protein
MFEYKGTEEFDIGAGYGEYEYDFFTVNDKDDFWVLMDHYGFIYIRFDYFLEGYKTIKNNTDLSPVVLAKMKEHNANLSLTLLEKKSKENNIIIREMVVNEQRPNGNMVTYSFLFFHASTIRAGDYLERGCAYARAG